MKPVKLSVCDAAAPEIRRAVTVGHGWSRFGHGSVVGLLVSDVYFGHGLVTGVSVVFFGRWGGQSRLVTVGHGLVTGRSLVC